MYIQRLTIQNVRSIRDLDITLREEESAGWHVILGDNGAGKSSVVRSLALALVGPREAPALRQDWSHWLRMGESDGEISITLSQDPVDRWTGTGRQSPGSITGRVSFVYDSGAEIRNPIATKFSGGFVDRTIWGVGLGWFSASFGPFRRFTGGDKDYERLFYSNPRLAAHLSAFGENVALTECLRWLQDLHIRSLEEDPEAKRIRGQVLEFLNNASLLPHGARIEDVTSQEVVMIDGEGCRIPVEQMSDGYRSILSLTFELIRQMFVVYGTDTVLEAMDVNSGRIALPGVVAIDEIDAHLHPAWQKRIGEWFVERFPKMQFFVTTHSPIICRAATNGSIWRLPTPGTDDIARRIEGNQLNRLLYGSILDAYGTEFFGEEVTRSEQSTQKLLELARLNRKRLKSRLSRAEEQELEALQAMLPSRVAETLADG